jgi:hypothetical protein
VHYSDEDSDEDAHTFTSISHTNSNCSRMVMRTMASMLMKVMMRNSANDDETDDAHADAKGS